MTWCRSNTGRSYNKIAILLLIACGALVDYLGSLQLGGFKKVVQWLKCVDSVWLLKDESQVKVCLLLVWTLCKLAVSTN